MTGVSVTAAFATIAIRSRFDYLPVSLFGSVMGLTGLSVAWQIVHARYGVPDWVATGVAVAAISAFILLTLGYATKLVSAPAAVLSEFRHPVAGNLFGTILISLLLLPIILVPVDLRLAQAVWAIGAVGMVVFAWLVVSRWLSVRQQVAHATPAWIVPMVGLLNVPLALPTLGLPPMHGVMVLGLAAGLFFAVRLFTLVFSRLVFEPPMLDALQPTLIILVAPFAVGFSSYVATTGHVDLFAESLYVLTLFMLVALVGRLRHLPTCCPFRVSWWAVSFPLAASATAALRFAAGRPGMLTDAIALALLALPTVTMVGMLVRTLVGVARGELRTLGT